MTCLKRPGGPLSTGTLVAGVALSLVLTASALSQDSAPATETPDWVAHQIDERDMGRDSRVEMTMRLFDRQGRARERSLVITTLRASGSRGDRLLVRFLSPGDIKGTGLLVWEHPKGGRAVFVSSCVQFATLPLTAEGRSLEGGVGLDRKAGAYRVSGNAVFTRRAPRASAPHVPAGEIDRSDLTVVASVDRSFARETRSIRTLAVYNPGDESAFARVIATLNMRDNVTLEGSGGVFTGSGSDLLARFAHRDFFYARLKVFF